MGAKSLVAVVGVAAAMILSISGTAQANQPWHHPGERYVGDYASEKECWYAAAEEIGRDPAHHDYSCGLTPQVRWALYVW